ncbi:MAG: hypothetical protein U0166_03135 [Acidobacteriota bacterium]
MLPFLIILGVLLGVAYVVSSSRRVKLPAMTECRSLEVVGRRRDEEALRSDRVQAVAASKVRYGTLTVAQEETFSTTRERIEELRKAA